jgi:hypothetical protein
VPPPFSIASASSRSRFDLSVEDTASFSLGAKIVLDIRASLLDLLSEGEVELVSDYCDARATEQWERPEEKMVSFAMVPPLTPDVYVRFYPCR